MSRLSAPIILWVVALLGCAAAEEHPARPDVVVIVIDTLRRDHCSAFGYALPTTPNMERIAARGTAFDVAYAPVGETSPSHATLFTSRYPIAHGLVRNGLKLGSRHTTMAEVLRREGYRTAAFVSSFPVSRTFGFERGFDHFDDQFDRADSSMKAREWGGEPVARGFDRDATATTDRALAWLDENRGDPDPLFLWTHYFDAHFPYEAPERYRDFFVRDPDPKSRERWIQEYDAEIAYVDAQVGRLADAVLDGRGRRDTLLIVTADHGEGLWDHDRLSHGYTTYEEELRVPLVMVWEGRLPPGHRSEQPAHLVDVAPTVYEALKLEGRAPGSHGIDLLPYVTGERPEDPERPIFAQRPHYVGDAARLRNERIDEERGRGLAVRRGQWKLFEAPQEERRELYDLSSDPEERMDLSAAEPARTEELSALLDTWLRGQLAERPAIEPSMPEDALEGLRALGYVVDHPEGAEGDSEP